MLAAYILLAGRLGRPTGQLAALPKAGAAESVFVPMERTFMKFIDLNRQYQAYQAEIDQAVMAVLSSGQFILGPIVAQLEERDSLPTVGISHAVGVSSGTDGLLLALMSYDVAPGDELLTTPFTFIATAEAILKAKPVFVDIDPQTFNMDVIRVTDLLDARRRAGGRVRGILPVSLYGQCPDMAELNTLAKSEGLFVIEDACQSFGATYQGRKSCGLTDIGVTSFFPSKPLRMLRRRRYGLHK